MDIELSPKGLTEEGWKRAQDIIGKITFSKPNEIAETDIAESIAYVRELLVALEDAEKRNHLGQDGQRTFTFSKKFSTVCDENEKALAAKLNKLARCMYSSLNEEDKKLFNMDGFYPYYTQQPLRLLFVGREACWMSGKNYIETLLKDLREGKVNSYSIDQYPFHKRQFYMAYGILSAVAKEDGELEFPEWNDVPWAADLGKILFARNNKNEEAYTDATIKPQHCFSGMSWAFMNLSKLSNDTGDWKTDDRRYRPFVESHKDCIKQEFDLLKPDLIIGANVYDLVNILGYDEKSCDRENANCYYYPSPKEGIPPFLNCYHFSAIKNDKTCFYDAVMQVLKKEDRLLTIQNDHKKWNAIDVLPLDIDWGCTPNPAESINPTGRQSPVGR